MSTLHLVYRAQALKHCLSRAEAGDIVLLLGAGALACLEPERFLNSEAVMWYVLEDALEAHDISREPLRPWMRSIDYAGFVEQAVAASRCLAWF